MILRSIRTVIEDTRPEDAARLAEIHERGFGRAWSAEEIRALMADYPIVQGFAIKRRPPNPPRTAGFLLMRVAGGEAEILTLAVDPPDRGRGYGRLLMEEAARRGYRERAESLFLEVDETNKAAVSLYRGLGFETVGERSRYYEKANAAPGSALVMKLPLR